MRRLREGVAALDAPLRRFWLLNLGSLASATVVLALVYLLGFRHSDVLHDLLVMAVSLAILLLSVLAAPRWGDRAVVLAMVAGTSVFAFGGTWVTPYLAPATVLLLLVPVLVAFPYLSVRGVRALVAYAVVASAAVGGIGELRRPLKAPESPEVGATVVASTLPFIVVVVAFAVWESYRRLHGQAAELRRSRTRLVEVADAARRSLERDLHDGAQQRLVAMSVRIAQARLAAESGQEEETRQLLADLSADTLLALSELRELARGIYPPLLAERGLVPAVQSIARRSVVPVTVHADEVPRLPRQVEAAVYFCVLEALQNVAKHAEASEVVVELGVDRGLTVVVRDDGRGFRPREVAAGDGLVGMEVRIAALGGTLAVTSAPREGTEVRGQLPSSALRP